MVVVLGGCGGPSMHRTNSHLSAGMVHADPEVAACMLRNGVTVLSNGELRVSKRATDAKRKAAEMRCSFRRKTNTARPKRNVANKHLAEKLPPTKPQMIKRRARRPLAGKPESFRGRVVANVVACLRKDGVNVPPSDSRLLSSTSGIKTRSPLVKAAIGKCRSESLATAAR